MSRNSETLARIDLFKSIGPGQIHALDTQCAWKKSARGQWIINYQDTNADVFFIVGGTARVKIQAMSGREVLLREINAGEFFGELAAIDGHPRSAGIVAVTDVVVAQMPAAVFRSTIHAHPDVCDQMLALLAGQIRTLANRVNEFSTLDARHRIYAELLRLSRPDAGKPKQAIVTPPPAHTDLAARVSIRREAVSREIKALERSGLIVRRTGAIVLTDTAKLQALIDAASEEA